MVMATRVKALCGAAGRARPLSGGRVGTAVLACTWLGGGGAGRTGVGRGGGGDAAGVACATALGAAGFGGGG
ncbi:hypothetical protein GCM10010442_44210 [Kitasatospora kifunensis]